MQYVQDNDRTFPDGANGYGEGTGWAGQLYPYVRNADRFKCPDDPTANPGVYTSYCINRNAAIYNPGGTGPNGEQLRNFTKPCKTVLLCEIANSGYYDITIGNQSVTGKSLGDDYGEPAGWAGGSPSGLGIGNGYDLDGFNAPPFGGTNSGTNVQYATGYLVNSAGSANDNFVGPTGRHRGGANYLLADAHAEWFLPSSVSGGYPNSTPGDCGSPSPDDIAATVGCKDRSIRATFNIN